jgi:two-component system sensor histidine kinase UhpB
LIPDSRFDSVAALRRAEPEPARDRSCIAREIAVRFNLIVGFSTVNGPLDGGTDCDAIGANLMWQKLSLRARINLLLALGLTLGLAINIARLVVEAGPRVRAEDQSVIRLAREFVETIVPGLNEAPDPDARLNQIVRDLSRGRAIPPQASAPATATTNGRRRHGSLRSFIRRRPP